MAKGLYQQVRKAWKKPDRATQRERMISWRKSNAFERVEKPLRIDRARNLGYKAKNGFVIIRARIPRGGHKRQWPKKGRRTKRMTNRKNLKISYKWIAEQRVQKKFSNLEVLNSYKIGKDGKHYFYEVICVDPSRKEVKNDKNLGSKKLGVGKKSNKKRALRGVTSAGKKSRGLRSKQPNNKNRPSVRAGKRRGK